MIIFGFGHKSIKDYGKVGENICPCCNNKVDLHKLKVTTWFTLYFIPIIPYKREYVVACPVCKNTFNTESDIVKNSNLNESENLYIGKTETQIAYLKQMEEYRNSKESE